jgi:hypothetical protein
MSRGGIGGQVCRDPGPICQSQVSLFISNKSIVAVVSFGSGRSGCLGGQSFLLRSIKSGPMDRQRMEQRQSEQVLAARC